LPNPSSISRTRGEQRGGRSLLEKTFEREIHEQAEPLCVLFKLADRQDHIDRRYLAMHARGINRTRPFHVGPDSIVIEAGCVSFLRYPRPGEQ